MTDALRRPAESSATASPVSKRRDRSLGPAPARGAGRTARGGPRRGSVASGRPSVVRTNPPGQTRAFRRPRRRAAGGLPGDRRGDPRCPLPPAGRTGQSLRGPRHKVRIPLSRRDRRPRRRAVALVGATASGKSALAHALALARGDVEIATRRLNDGVPGHGHRHREAHRAEQREVPYHLARSGRARRGVHRRAVPARARAPPRRRRGAGASPSLRRRDRPLRSRGDRRSRDSRPATPRCASNSSHARATTPAVSTPNCARSTRWPPPDGAHQRPPRRARPRGDPGCGRPFSSYGRDSGLRPAPRRPGRASRAIPTSDERISGRFRALDGRRTPRGGADAGARPGGCRRTARQAVGYRELLRHVEEAGPLDECVRDAITQRRRLARRQRSWFQRDPRVEWFDDPAAAAHAPGRRARSPDGVVVRRLRAMMALRSLQKWHGAGNDFLVDVVEPGAARGGTSSAPAPCATGAPASAPTVSSSRARSATGITMILYNADGRVAEMSGNGIRCLVGGGASSHQGRLGRVGVSSPTPG